MNEQTTVTPVVTKEKIIIKEIVVLSTRQVGIIIKLMKEALKKKNYWLTNSYKESIRLATTCPDVIKIYLFYPKWEDNPKLSVGLFHRSDLINSYNKKGLKFKIIHTS